MRVLLISNFALDRQESMLRFARQLSDGLRAQQHTVTTWSPEPRLARLLPRYRYGGAAKFIGYFDKYVLFPRRVRHQLRKLGAPDIVHIVDHANAVYAPLFAGRPLVATCHDLLQIRAARGELSEHQVSSMGRRYQMWILKHIAKLPHVVVPSTQTASDLRRLTGLPPDRITTIPNGLNFPYQRVAPAGARLAVGCLLRERQLSPGLLEHGGRGFLLNVGGGQWYKNRRGLLDIYAALRGRLAPAPRLLMVGKPLNADLQAQVKRLGLEDDVIVISDVSELQLQAIYSLAEGLIFPSWLEGFGWPVAEAQACGCPVFTSDRPPMTEVGGDAAVYISPGNAADAADRIAAVWPLRRQWGQRGLERASLWDPALMIERYVTVYERLVGRRNAVAV
jgi:glycosyltransferase involved in cell wall biosynthesis